MDVQQAIAIVESFRGGLGNWENSEGEPVAFGEAVGIVLAEVEWLRAVLIAVRDRSRIVDSNGVPEVVIEYEAWKKAAKAAGGERCR